MSKSVLERFEDKIERVPESGCWIWIGATQFWGYGTFWYKGKNRKAHRFSYEFFIGPIPKREGRHRACICHKCDISACVNPAHLFIGSQHDNVKDCIRKGRRANSHTYQTHCKNGHEFTSDNTYRPKRGGRQCRQCDNDRKHRKYWEACVEGDE